jgi:peptidoglycan/LPS O-acetylase OafA/YrhL
MQIVRSGAMPQSGASRHRRDIQGLRAVAVLLVVFGHAGVPFLKSAYVVCPIVIGRTIAYLDRGHITQVYAAELAGPFAGAFRRVVRQLPS